MESKYRYRNVSDYDVLEEPIPSDSKERRAEYRKQGLGMKKVDGRGWCWVRYKDTQRTENPDIADTFNTILKMAAKRAAVAATLSATAASDIFTQDMEEADPGVEGERPSTVNQKPGKAQSFGDRLTALMNGTGLNDAEKRELRDGYSKVADKSSYLDLWEKRASSIPSGAGVPDDKIPH